MCLKSDQLEISCQKVTQWDFSSASVLHGSKYVDTVVLLYAIDFDFTDGETESKKRKIT